jgi:drug efflux transport system ATP-binding protein
MSEPIVIQVENVYKKLGQTEALSNVSLSFKQGLMQGIIGPEGAGKTTLFRTLLGLLRPDAGRVIFLQGTKTLTLSDIRIKVAYMPQQQSLYPDLSIEEHLDFFRMLYQIPEQEYLIRKKDLLQMTQLDDFVSRAAAKLSGGMYKKLGLMCALLREPEVLFLDEPTNGVDPVSRREFWDLLYRLLDRNMLIVVSTAYMDEAERCAKVYLLEEGKVVSKGRIVDE